MSDATQLQLLLSITIVLFSIGLLVAFAERLIRVYGPWSAKFSTANAGSNFSKKMRNLIKSGDKIYIPTGAGKYPLSISDRARSTWENTFRTWLDLGAHITIIISSPNEEATVYWKNVVERFPSNFRVCLLDRAAASTEDAIEIGRLDTFHPLLVIRESTPLAMWIENFHPPESRVAYNVEFVATKDIVSYQRERFDRYFRILQKLTSRDRGPPHLLTLMREDSLQKLAA